MTHQQLTTEIMNRLQLTIEVPSAVNCRRKKEGKKKTHRHLSAEDLRTTIFSTNYKQLKCNSPSQTTS